MTLSRQRADKLFELHSHLKEQSQYAYADSCKAVDQAVKALHSSLSQVESVEQKIVESLVDGTTIDLLRTWQQVWTTGIHHVQEQQDQIRRLEGMKTDRLQKLHHTYQQEQIWRRYVEKVNVAERVWADKRIQMEQDDMVAGRYERK